VEMANEAFVFMAHFLGNWIFWLVISLNGGVYSWKQEASEPKEDKSYFLLERFNVSKEQIQDLANLILCSSSFLFFLKLTEKWKKKTN